MWLTAANVGFLAAALLLYFLARRWMFREQNTGRDLESRACALTSLLVVAGFALAHVGVNYSLVGHAGVDNYDWLVFALEFCAALVAAHVLLRLLHSRVDQLLLPVAAFLAALGLINIYVWETRDANAYVSTVALPALREYEASLARDASAAPPERGAPSQPFGPVPNELEYEADPQNRSRGRFATVLNSHWLAAYNRSVGRLQAWLHTHPGAKVAPAVRELSLYHALRKQLIVAALCLLLIPGVLFGARQAPRIPALRGRDLLWVGGLALVSTSALLLLQSDQRLPALLQLGELQLTTYDPLKLALIVVLAVTAARVVANRAKAREPAVLFGFVAITMTVAVMLWRDLGSGVALLTIAVLMTTFVADKRFRYWVIAYGAFAVFLAPLAVSRAHLPFPDTARLRLQMWADPWKSYHRTEVSNLATNSAKRIIERRSSHEHGPGAPTTERQFTAELRRTPTSKATDGTKIPSLIRGDVSHIEQELRWRLQALQIDAPDAAPFVPGPDPGEAADLLEAEELWSALGGYTWDKGSGNMQRFEGAVNDALAQLKADTERHILRVQANGGSYVGEAQLRAETAARGPPEATNFQLQRSLFALRAGGTAGVGLGLGKPEALPAMTQDVPLAGIGEALGFAGVVMIALLILLIAVRGIEAGRARAGSAGGLMIIGFSAMLGLQAFLGMSAISGILPFTGLTFPFLSRSGSALVANFAALALLLAFGASRPRGSGASRQASPMRPRHEPALLLKGAGFPAAFAVVLASFACVQLAGRTLAPGSFLSALPDAGSPMLHAEDAWERPSYRIAPGPIVDRKGRVLAKTPTLGGERVYPDAKVGTSLAQTLLQLGVSFRHEFTQAVGKPRALPDAGQSPPVGPTLVTTIDSEVQRAVHQAFDQGATEGGLGGVERLRGAAVVVDARNGDILALDSRPSFSLAELSDRSTWMNAEAADRRAGLPYRYLNRVVQGYYPPGSIFKTITAAAALDTGLHSLHARDFDYRRGEKGPRSPDGLLQLGRWHELSLPDGPAITDGNHPGLEDWQFNIETGYAWSCNLVFAELGLELGPARLVDFARRFGFERSIEVPGLGVMKSTLDNDHAKSSGLRYLARSKSNLARTAFGQGQVRTTPLQMALVAAAIANGGDLMQPRLVAGWRNGGQWVERTSPTVFQKTGLSQSTIEDMRRMMHASATYGWAQRANLNQRNSHPGVAGKTGSAEWSEEHDAPHSWFMGYFPSESPRVAIALLVERGGLGPTVAVRIARHIFGVPALRRYLANGSTP